MERLAPGPSPTHAKSVGSIRTKAGTFVWIGVNGMRQWIGFDAPVDKDVIPRPARSTPTKAAPKAPGEDDEDAPDGDAA